MKHLLIILLLTGWSLCSFCQDAGSPARKVKYQFRSVSNAGFLLGQAGDALQLQTIAGLQRGLYLTGIGAGIDNYGVNSVPVFVHLRRFLSKQYQRSFAYTDGGVNLSHDNNENIIKYKAGLYMDAGLGYALPIGKDVHLLFSAGYSIKTIKEYSYEYTYISSYPLPNSTYKNSGTTERIYRRVLLKAGISF